ncbi:putative molybdenum carrier protein [Azohydromonas lata]|uniref:Molybdenum carrier protein n=1 Tax=Azohydromonas lata TaxID=45677 RepID=A0ABU5I794_9BURK|nr:putative molybdenum carrier protein [Azohydromonas lata]MDZ5454969.1 putative molybdenum carrier protein [Azohydromonas lata]
MIERVVSGGQTGADRGAALDWALARGVPHGGWCPAARIAEDGTIPSQHQLTEMPNGGGYCQRTKANVRNADATLLLSVAPERTGGSRQTMIFARQLAKPWLHLHPGMDWRSALRTWIDANSIATLNVAGLRASSAPAIDSFTVEVLDVLAQMTAMACAE